MSPDSAGAQHPQLADERVLAIVSRRNLIRLDEHKKLLLPVFPRTDFVSPDSLESLAATVRRSHNTHRTVLAIGGDGTLHQVLQHIDTQSQVLALLPAGTGNDLARNIGLPQDYRKAARCLATARVRPADLCTAGGLRFHNSAGLGLDVETLRVRDSSTGLLHTNYILAFIAAMNRLKPLDAELEIDGERERRKAAWLLAMNSAYIGKGVKIAPDASLFDGKLDLIIVPPMSKLSMLLLIPRARAGKHISRGIVTHRRFERLTIRTTEPLTYFAVDGELCFHGSRELTIEVQQGALSLLCCEPARTQPDQASDASATG